MASVWRITVRLEPRHLIWVFVLVALIPRVGQPFLTSPRMLRTCADNIIISRAARAAPKRAACAIVRKVRRRLWNHWNVSIHRSVRVDGEMRLASVFRHFWNLWNVSIQRSVRVDGEMRLRLIFFYEVRLPICQGRSKCSRDKR